MDDRKLYTLITIVCSQLVCALLKKFLTLFEIIMVKIANEQPYLSILAISNA